MASSLTDFYEIKPEDLDVIKETLTVKANNGKEYDVEVKGLPYNQFARIKILSTFSYDNGNGQSSSQVEELTFCLKLCSRGIVTPSLNDAKLRAIHHTHNPEDLVLGLFPPQSIIALGSKIAELSLNRDDVKKDENGDIIIDSGVDPDLLEEAKN